MKDAILTQFPGSISSPAESPVMPDSSSILPQLHSKLATFTDSLLPAGKKPPSFF